MDKPKGSIFSVPTKLHEWITIPLQWIAWVVGVGFLIGLFARILYEPIRWGWVICERLIQ